MTTSRPITLFGTTACLAAIGLAPLAAQTPTPEIVACYDSRTNGSGTPIGTGIVYRIKVPGVMGQQGCTDPKHTQFSWTAVHGALTGLDADDHKHYLLAGVRAAPDGFAVTGTLGSGAIPTSGAGARLMWYPAKSAFRVGSVAAAEWDDASVGLFSTAIGRQTTASGNASAALGMLTTASGELSTAMGTLASTNGQSGAFVYGDASTAASKAVVTASAPNEFVVRAAGGVRLRTSSDLSTGCNVTAPSGALTCSGKITSTSGGFQFPDGTVQTTAGGAGPQGPPGVSGWEVVFSDRWEIQPASIRSIRVACPAGKRPLAGGWGSDDFDHEDELALSFQTGPGPGSAFSGSGRPFNVLADRPTFGYPVFGGGTAPFGWTVTIGNTDLASPMRVRVYVICATV